jgi:hypothetical protein
LARAIGHLSIVMRKRLGCLEQTIAAAALYFLGDPEMQFHARPGQQTLIHCIAHERVFELILVLSDKKARSGSSW